MMLMKDRADAIKKTASYEKQAFLKCSMKNPAIAEAGTAKNIIVKIYSPFWIPNSFTAAVGNIEKCPPSHAEARATQTVYKKSLSLT